MEQKQDLGYLLNEEAEAGEEEELSGSLQRRQPRTRSTKNSYASSVPAADLGSAEITTTSSNVSTLTYEEHEPEPEPVQEQDQQYDPDEDFEVHTEQWVSKGGPRDGVDGVVAEGSDGDGVGEADEEEWQQSVTFEKEQGIESAHEHGEPEHGDVEFNACITDWILEANGREDLIKDSDEIRNLDVGLFASRKAQENYACDLTAEQSKTKEVVSHLKYEHENSEGRLLSPKKSNQEESAISFVEEVEPEETEYDVETVLEKQNTHDLFCPKCHSCITRRVILRRRRRRVPRFRPGFRGGRVTPATEPHVTEPITEPEDQDSAAAVITPGSDIPTDTAEDRRNDRAEAFRCLSCCSFFIPTGDGLFRIFQKRSDAGNMQEPQEVPVAVATENSFFSFFQWKKKPAVLEGSDAPDTTPENKTQQIFDSGMPNDSVPNQNGSVPSAEDTAVPNPLPSVDNVISEPEKVEEGRADSFSQDTDLGEPLPKIAPDFDNAVIKPDPAEVVAPSTSVTVVVGQTIVSIDQKPAKKPEEDLPVHNDHSTVTEVSSPSKSLSSTTEPKLAVVDRVIFPIPHQKVNNDAVKEPEEPPKKSPGDTVVVTIGPVAASETTSITDTSTDIENPPQVVTQALLSETRPAEVPGARDFDILKSIVYGGLVESVASLSVVSSAAGGGATTLNTLALALANLVGGLFVLAHNLRELKNEQSSGNQTQTDVEQDKYYQQHGRRGKFSLHATVAVISFLVFGSVAPITYGFSFRKSDDRDYKLAAVAAASLLCILLLALGKAHVRSKSYIKTALYYLMMGFAGSGISFVVGELVDKLMERLGLFESSSSAVSVTGVLGEMSRSGSGSGWASY
ncbi:hypothetical protein CDL15_Pgr023115 [Punica granatum]|uniref:Membrane protein of ER body-like protein n=1 Tax=Punica granatum TaxID=22663 RepID=A0A218X430_PUNGR|nr:hypothetical protein CDL15_Pgr023115 [Punica granatum]